MTLTPKRMIFDCFCYLDIYLVILSALKLMYIYIYIYRKLISNLIYENCTFFVLCIVKLLTFCKSPDFRFFSQDAGLCYCTWQVLNMHSIYMYSISKCIPLTGIWEWLEVLLGSTCDWHLVFCHCSIKYN